MEAWHSVNLDSISPLTALSLTTSRWGLEPLPGNLAVSNLTLKHLQSQNATNLPVWEFIYGCQTRVSEGEWNLGVYKDIPIDTTFCSEPKRCGKSNCVNLIEGIGRTTTGPTGANIIGLAHGVSILIVIISTITMGLISRIRDKLEAEFPPPKKGIDSEHMKKYYTSKGNRDNPPVPVPPTPAMPAPRQGRGSYFVPPPSDEKKSKEISQCTDLLRQMYDLELQIKSAKDNIWGTEPRVDRRRERADALRNEIQHTVNDWKRMPSGYFTTAERSLIDEICDAINSSYQQRG